MPITLQRYGSVGSIAYERRNVNISGENFSEMIKTGDRGGTVSYSVTPEEGAEAIVNAAEEADAGTAAAEVDERSPQEMLGKRWRESLDKEKNTFMKAVANILGVESKPISAPLSSLPAP